MAGLRAHVDKALLRDVALYKSGSRDRRVHARLKSAMERALLDLRHTETILGTLLTAIHERTEHPEMFGGSAIMHSSLRSFLVRAELAEQQIEVLKKELDANPLYHDFAVANAL